MVARIISLEHELKQNLHDANKQLDLARKFMTHNSLAKLEALESKF